MMQFTNDIFMGYTYNYKIANPKAAPADQYSALDSSFLRVDGLNEYTNTTSKDVQHADAESYSDENKLTMQAIADKIYTANQIKIDALIQRIVCQKLFY